MRSRWRVKLRPISMSSRLILRRPSAMLIRQNGIKIATSTNMTPKSPGSNQIAARIAQPIEGNELSTGLIRSSTTASSQGTPWVRNASPPPMRRAAKIETRTRQVDVNTCHWNSGIMNNSISRRATASGPGRMNSGKVRANAHHPSSATMTRPSPIRRSAAADVVDVRSAPIVTRHVGLQRGQQVPVHAVHETDDENDGREDRRGIELLARQVDHVAKATVASEQLGGQRHLPGHPEHDSKRGKDERV